MWIDVMRTRHLVILAGLLLACAHAWPAPGRLLCLDPAGEDGGFLGVTGELPAAPAFVRARYDATNLYITVSQAVTNRAAIKAVGTPDHPAQIFGGSVMELFLAPEPGGTDYYQIAANPSGVVYQARGGDCSWRPAVPINCQPVVGEDGWRVEFIVPFKGLGRSYPRKGERWGANFVCGQSWAAVSDLHNASQFGTLLFGETRPAASIDEFVIRGDHCRFRVTSRADVPLAVSLRIDGQPAGVGGNLLAKRGDSLLQTQSLQAQEATHKGIRTLDLTVTDAASGAVLAQRSGVLGGRAVDLLVLDQYYYELTNGAALHYATRGTERVNLRLSAVGREEVKRLDDQPATGQLPLEGIAPGDYRFSVERDGRPVAATLVVLRPAGAPEAKAVAPEGALSATGAVLTVGGVPVYPVVSQPRSLLDIRGCTGSSFADTPVVGYRYLDDDTRHLAVAAEAVKAGAKTPRTLYRICYEAQFPVILARPDDPASVRVMDNIAPFYAHLYQLLKTAHPGVLFSIQNDGQRHQKALARSCDVLETAFWSSGYATCLMPKLDRDLAAARADAGRDKPILVWLGGSLPSGLTRSAEELRAGIYLSLIRGMAGNVIHLGHGNIPKSRTREWSLLAGIEGEINAFYPDFVQWEPADALLPVPHGERYPGSFALALRRQVNAAGGTDYLLVALNLSATANSLDLAFAGGKLPRLTDRTFTPYEPRLFRWTVP
jgi:hypothetical protein